MAIDLYDNNCSMVAIQQVRPDLCEHKIVDACMKAGFTDWLGMLPHQIELALQQLSIEYTTADLLQYKPTIKHGDHRTSLTLNQALAMTSTEVCLIRVTGHILASYKGIPVDPNMKKRGPRRRVLGLYVIHNTTMTRHVPSAITRDPLIQFVHDMRHDARSRRDMYDAIYKYMGNPHGIVRYSVLKQFGYTRRMLRRHVERGDVILHS